MKVWGIWLAINILISVAGIYFFREKKYNIGREEKITIILYIFIFLAVFFLQMVEVKIDPIITSSFSMDFTRKIYNIEGGIASVFQTIRNPVLDYYFAIIYMIGYPFLLYFTPVLYMISRDINSLKLVVMAYTIAISISLPFLLFFPVHDVWWASSNYAWYSKNSVSFILGEIWPSYLSIFYKFTTLNNCFPSLHSALSAEMAYSAIISGYRRYSFVAVAIAISIPIATLYLGIHWLLDVIAGEAIAIIAVMASLKIAGMK